MVELPGKLGAELARAGEAAMRAYAAEWLADLFGADVKRAVGRVHSTQWSKDPWSLGAFSAATPGGSDARETLMAPVRERVYFAGEAVHASLWGTVSGRLDGETRGPGGAASCGAGECTGEQHARKP